MRILIFNWKDPANPAAGGAETFTHEIAKRWVEWGDEVTLFCQSFSGADEHDSIDGVRVIRRGGKLSVYRRAKSWYRQRNRPEFDLVIDEINTRPFLTPTFVKDAPVVALIHQLAREVWNEEVAFPMSPLGRYVLEPRWLSHYRTVSTVTISSSTQKDLLRLGFAQVRVVPGGLGPLPAIDAVQKQGLPTLLFVGRLVKTKRPHHAIAAWRVVREAIPDAQLWIVGDGYMRSALERQASEGVRIFGSVDERTKYELMGRAHALLVPGVREGWGLVVIEANAMGTPAVAYRIPGLVDSVRHEQSGVLTDPNPRALGLGAARLLGDAARLSELGANARAWAAGFDWDVTAKSIREALVWVAQ